MSAYCTKDDVKQRMSGDVPVMSAAFDNVITGIIAEVSDEIDDEVRLVRSQPDGWSFTPGSPTTRRYSGTGSTLLMIDDATAVTSVAITDSTGATVQTLSLGADYVVWPANSLPIVGLRMVNGWWPAGTLNVSVGLTPGYALSVPTDVKEQTIVESIRRYRGGLAGEDDRLGVEPYRPQTVTKALLASTYRMVKRYRLGAGLLREPQ